VPAKRRILFITDPWDTLDHAADTSLRLLEAAWKHPRCEPYWADARSLRLEAGRVRLDAWLVDDIAPTRVSGAFRFSPVPGFRESRRRGSHKVRPRAPAEPSDFDLILYRPDPPVDLAYLQPLQLIVLGLESALRRKKNSPRKTRVINPPEALFLASEKLEPALLGALMPASCVSSRLEVLERFGASEGRAVLKPLHEAQSHGVELLSWRTPAERRHARASLRQATSEEKRPVLLQRFLEAIRDGEQRLWFLDGKLLAHARKLPRLGEFRIDMDQGGRLARSTLSAAEKKAIPRIGKALRRRGIRMAAVDLIEGLVTDYNITSPGLLVGMETLLGRDLASPIIEALLEGA
jgi:glutathione synthase